MGNRCICNICNCRDSTYCDCDICLCWLINDSKNNNTMYIYMIPILNIMSQEVLTNGVLTHCELIPEEFLIGVQYVDTTKEGKPFKNGANKVLHTTQNLRSFLMAIRMKSRKTAPVIAIDSENRQYWLWEIDGTEGKFTLVMCKPYSS